MAKKEQLATAPQNDNAIMATSDELGGLDLTGQDDGLSEVEQTDYRDAVYALNFKGQDKSGRAIPVDVFYNTLDETTHPEINAVLCHLHKSNLYSRFDEATQKTDIICRSYDRVTGTMADGTTRPCEGCPDAKWRMDAATGKRRLNCGEVWNVFGVNRDTAQGFVLRFKRTAVPVIRTHLQKHHLKRRVRAGKRGNYPLYAFAVRLSGKMAGPKATYALPVIERCDPLPDAEILVHAANTTELADRMRKALERSEDRAEAADGEGDTSFDVDKMSAAEGQDFVDAEGERVA